MLPHRFILETEHSHQSQSQRRYFVTSHLILSLSLHDPVDQPSHQPITHQMLIDQLFRVSRVDASVPDTVRIHGNRGSFPTTTHAGGFRYFDFTLAPDSFERSAQSGNQRDTTARGAINVPAYQHVLAHPLMRVQMRHRLRMRLHVTRTPKESAQPADVFRERADWDAVLAVVAW